MMVPARRPSRAVTEVRRDGAGLVLVSEAGVLRLQPRSDRIVRVTYTGREQFRDEPTPGVIHEGLYADWEHVETETTIRLSTALTTIEVDRVTGSTTYRASDGTVLLRERTSESKTLEEFQAFRTLDDESLEVEEVVTPDGVKRVIRSAVRVAGDKLYRARLHLRWQDGESLYGLGQHEEGVLDLRGTRVYLHQANLKIAVPVLASSLGYGILVDTYSPMVFSDTEHGSYLYCEAVHEMDFYFINGGSLDGVVAGYRQLTGKAVMLPRWAYGYVQSKERYESRAELVAVTKEFRDRGLSLDAIVLDWQYWPEGLWGQKTLDPQHFPDPDAMVAELHDDHVRMIISLWPHMDEKSPNYAQFKDRGLLLPGSTTYDAFDPKAREVYWQQVNEQFFPAGVDGWWCDNSEPLTPEWLHRVKPEPDAAYHEYVDESAKLFDAAALNAFSLYHAMGLYEGQRNSGTRKRMVNITRSAWTGQQRYGTVLWSGDTSASWATYRRQIVAGLNLCASGLPYWHTDIGAFFTARGAQWFWDGHYAAGNQDPAYRELYVRWFQYGAFSPFFRSHGTDTSREPWRFGDVGEPFYDALVAAQRLRYSLHPYLYTQAFRVWNEDASIMRMLAFDFPDDPTARATGDQFLFGDSLMVCPVTTPMYFTTGGEPLGLPTTREVYLPRHPGGWFDLHTGAHHPGGMTITAHADIGTIPVYVKAGSVVPLFRPAQSTDELDRDTVDVKVFPGRDAVFDLYDDDGDGFEYEDGHYALTRLSWNEQSGSLTVEAPTGPLAEALADRTYHVEVVR